MPEYPAELEAVVDMAARRHKPTPAPAQWGAQFRREDGDWLSTSGVLPKGRKARYKTRSPAEADLDKVLEGGAKYGVVEGRIVWWDAQGDLHAEETQYAS